MTVPLEGPPIWPRSGFLKLCQVTIVTSMRQLAAMQMMR